MSLIGQQLFFRFTQGLCQFKALLALMTNCFLKENNLKMNNNDEILNQNLTLCMYNFMFASSDIYPKHSQISLFIK